MQHSPDRSTGSVDKTGYGRQFLHIHDPNPSYKKTVVRVNLVLEQITSLSNHWWARTGRVQATGSPSRFGQFGLEQIRNELKYNCILQITLLPTLHSWQILKFKVPERTVSI